MNMWENLKHSRRLEEASEKVTWGTHFFPSNWFKLMLAQWLEQSHAFTPGGSDHRQGYLEPRCHLPCAHFQIVAMSSWWLPRSWDVTAYLWDWLKPLFAAQVCWWCKIVGIESTPLEFNKNMVDFSSAPSGFFGKHLLQRPSWTAAMATRPGRGVIQQRCRPEVIALLKVGNFCPDPTVI